MRRTFPTPGPLQLTVNVPAGAVSLETVDGTETEVTLEPMTNDEASREAVDTARVELRERAGGGQEVIVEVGEARRFGFDFGEGRRFGISIGRGAEVALSIRAPHGAGVRAGTGSADVSGAGRFGAVEASSGSGDLSFESADAANVKTGSGDVDLGHIRGELKVQAASGDVEVDVAERRTVIHTASGDIVVNRLLGPGSLACASGDAHVGDVRASLDVSTASGDQQIDAASEGSLNLKSASGDLNIGIRMGSTLWVDAKSRSGETSSELEVGDDPPEEGGPLVELRATTMSGDIHIFRAPALVEQGAFE